MAQTVPAAFVRLLLRICELLLVSALIELAMSLPMAIYFHRVTALGLPVNLLVVPLIGLALPSALITFATLLVWPSLAIVPGAVTAALLHAINGIVRLFSGMAAGDIRIPDPGALAIVAGILLIGLAVWAARNSRFPVAFPIAALACSAACVFYPRALAYHPGVLEVTAIDVGQGDSLLLISPEGKTLLVDAGGPTGGGSQGPSGNFEIGEDVVSPVLWSRNIRRLDAVALSHAHSDHMGGMACNPAQLSSPGAVGGDQSGDPGLPTLSWPKPPGSTFRWKRWLRAAALPSAARGSMCWPRPSITWQARLPAMTIRWCSTWPTGRPRCCSKATPRRPVSGKCSREGLHADLLKIGHHGSKTSTTPRFLAAVAPTYAVISVAHRNPYGHPKLEILHRLQDDHVRTFRTDALGATSFYLNGSSVSAEPLAAR